MTCMNSAAIFIRNAYLSGDCGEGPQVTHTGHRQTQVPGAQ